MLPVALCARPLFLMLSGMSSSCISCVPSAGLHIPAVGTSFSVGPHLSDHLCGGPSFTLHCRAIASLSSREGALDAGVSPSEDCCDPSVVGDIPSEVNIPYQGFSCFVCGNYSGSKCGDGLSWSPIDQIVFWGGCFRHRLFHL